MSAFKELRDWELLALEQGRWLTTFPIGYKNIQGKRSKYTNRGDIEIDPIDSQFVKDVFNIFSEGGHSLTSLTLEMQKKWNKPIHRSNIAHILRNKFYIGIMTWKGREFSHKYPLFIDQEIFNICQKILDYNNKYSLYSKSRIIESKIDNPNRMILELCKNPIDINSLSEKLNIEKKELQKILWEMESKNLIEETLFHKWIII